MINGLCPDYLYSFVPATFGNNTAHNLRNASDYKYIRSNTQLYNNFFLPSVVRDRNELSILLEMQQVLVLLKTQNFMQ